MRAKEFLQQYGKLKILIENNKKQAEQWRAMAAGTTSRFGTDKVQSSGNPDKMADAIGKALALEDENARAMLIMTDIENVIKQLSANQYDLLNLVYIDGLSLGKVAKKKNYSYDGVKAAHRRALKGVQNILDERKF